MEGDYRRWSLTDRLRHAPSAAAA